MIFIVLTLVCLTLCNFGLDVVKILIKITEKFLNYFRCSMIDKKSNVIVCAICKYLNIN